MPFVQYVAAIICVVAVGCTAKATSTFEDIAAEGGRASALEAGAPCRTASDCGPGLACGFRALDGCGARGVCVHKDVGACFGTPPDCACDGTLTSSCGTGGYTDKPFAHAGPEHLARSRARSVGPDWRAASADVGRESASRRPPVPPASRTPFAAATGGRSRRQPAPSTMDPGAPPSPTMALAKTAGPTPGRTRADEGPARAAVRSRRAAGAGATDDRFEALRRGRAERRELGAPRATASPLRT